MSKKYLQKHFGLMKVNVNPQMKWIKTASFISFAVLKNQA